MSNGFLLDTTILIDLFRGRREAIIFLDQLTQEGSLYICPIVVAEIFSGIRSEEFPRVEEFFKAMNFCPINYNTAKKAGTFRRHFQKRGITLSISDTLIAATAIDNTLTLVTKNVRHFPMEELDVIEHL
ncbi:Ribonuclease VapC19 [Sporotomaculum syntrophicum]|uniref:Ribonuclease VapC19 n=1 Tax=Sporotomaculum syntrophicum TaxID=182264 RepID=A0A9D3AZE2_9FIRM|nr:type II toxin-antitoxin system VapC family toxin [Sporotomaculum syntrophicum]KAF1086441.1 Ribonuclease VapC19 [Sporotomaculum syntrophicum]